MNTLVDLVAADEGGQLVSYSYFNIRTGRRTSAVSTTSRTNADHFCTALEEHEQIKLQVAEHVYKDGIRLSDEL